MPVLGKSTIPVTPPFPSHGVNCLDNAIVTPPCPLSSTHVFLIYYGFDTNLNLKLSLWPNNFPHHEMLIPTDLMRRNYHY